MAKILRGYHALDYDKAVIKEAIEQKKDIVVKALLQRADAENQNHRIYPRAILEREVENYRKSVLEKRSCGELDHPDSSVVSLENVSHMVTEIHWEGNEVHGSLLILNTPKGKIAQSLLESGVRLGISSRGVGEVDTDESGIDVVNTSFMLLAFDLVSEPSTQDAWLMSEGKEVDMAQIRQMTSKVDLVNRIANKILAK